MIIMYINLSVHTDTQTQAHTHIAQRHTLIHSLSHNKYVCNGKAHACFTHTHGNQTETHKEIPKYTHKALIPQDTQRHRYIRQLTETYWSQSDTNTDAYSHTYLNRDIHPLPNAHQSLVSEGRWWG